MTRPDAIPEGGTWLVTQAVLGKLRRLADFSDEVQDLGDVLADLRPMSVTRERYIDYAQRLADALAEAGLRLVRDEDPNPNYWESGQVSFKVDTPCPRCGNARVLGFYYLNQEGEHQHTHYVCTWWPHPDDPGAYLRPDYNAGDDRCAWHGWRVPRRPEAKAKRKDPIPW